MTRLETKDGLKEVSYLDPKTAAQMLTLEGWQRYIQGKVIRLQDFKVDVLGRMVSK